MKAASPSRHQILWQGHQSLWDYSGTIALGIVLAPVGIGLLILILVYLSRNGMTYVVTGKNVMISQGMFITSTRELRVGDIRSIEIRRNGCGGLFGIGDVILSTAARDDASVVFAGIAEAEEIAELIREIQDGGGPSALRSTPEEGWKVIIAFLCACAIVVGAVVLFGYLNTPHVQDAPVAHEVQRDTPRANALPSPSANWQGRSTFASASVPTTPASTPTTIALSQRAAVRKYPPLGIKGSTFNFRFLSRLADWQARNDSRLSRSDWPEVLADDCATNP